MQLGGDLRIGLALGDQGDQLPFPGAELPRAWAAGGVGPGSVSIRAYSAAVTRLIAAPRSSASRARPGPSACRASRRPDNGTKRAQIGKAGAFVRGAYRRLRVGPYRVLYEVKGTWSPSCG